MTVPYEVTRAVKVSAIAVTASAAPAAAATVAMCRNRRLPAVTRTPSRATSATVTPARNSTRSIGRSGMNW